MRKLGLLLCCWPTIGVADTYHCEGLWQDQQTEVRLIVETDRLQLFLPSAHHEFTSVETVKDGVRAGELMPGTDDERIVTRRMIQFQKKEGLLIYIEHVPATRMLRATCEPEPGGKAPPDSELSF